MKEGTPLIVIKSRDMLKNKLVAFMDLFLSFHTAHMCTQALLPSQQQCDEHPRANARPELS